MINIANQSQPPIYLTPKARFLRINRFHFVMVAAQLYLWPNIEPARKMEIIIKSWERVNITSIDFQSERVTELLHWINNNRFLMIYTAW